MNRPCPTPRNVNGEYDLTAAIINGGDEEEVLEHLLARAVQNSAVKGCALVLQGVEDSWLTEFAAGMDTVGTDYPADSAMSRALISHDLDAIYSLTPEEIYPSTAEDWANAWPIAGTTGFAGVLVARFSEEPCVETLARFSHYADITAFALASAETAQIQQSADIADERRRIARDLHDLAIQELFAVGMQLDQIKRDAIDLRGGEMLARQVAASLQGVDHAVAQIRQIVQTLRHDSTTASLSERLHHEAALAITGLGFAPSIHLDTQALDREVNDDIAEDVVAVVRECLANAARHADASAVAVTVTIFSEGVDRVVRINVSDNGRGIDPTVKRSSGLSNMRSRARRHNGWVDILPLDQGTMVSWRATLPAVE